MTLLDLAPCSTISTPQLRLALLSRKTEVMRMHRDFPESYPAELYEKAMQELDSFLLHIDGSTSIEATCRIGGDKQNGGEKKDNDSESASRKQLRTSVIDFTIGELQEKIKGLPQDGYFRQEGQTLYYFFTLRVEQKGMLDNSPYYDLTDIYLPAPEFSEVVRKEYPFVKEDDWYAITELESDVEELSDELVLHQEFRFIVLA
jgi:hypothetical protein